MLVSEGKTALKRYGFSDTDPLLTWLNAGMREFEAAHDWSFLMNLIQVSSAIGNAGLTVSPVMFKVESIKSVTTGVKLKYLAWLEFESGIEDPTEQGTPRFYTVIGPSTSSTIQLYPVPDTVEDYRVLFQQSLTDMANDGDPMPGPSRIHYPIVLAAAYIALQAENEEERSVTALTQFERSVDRLWTKYNKSELDEPQQVEDVMGYSS
jgi:hypothetical protein